MKKIYFTKINRKIRIIDHYVYIYLLFKLIFYDSLSIFAKAYADTAKGP